jgi:hypothetical protein
MSREFSDGDRDLNCSVAKAETASICQLSAHHLARHTRREFFGSGVIVAIQGF